MDDFAKRLIAVRPRPRQVAWQQKEWTAFFHFGINTFTNREWGTGQESPALFAPDAIDTDQWCRVIRDAGMRGCILTAKHHDGFCLWDTRQTDHSVMHSPFGRDVVRMLADSCKRYGLSLGLYLSPWDRHEQTYGQGDAYNDFFCAQLEELLTGYGPLFELWFDGACGEGPNGKVQQYDWERIYALIRRRQPDACIAVCGPDVRWCGNEAGQWRESEWSVVPASLRNAEKVQEASQQEDSAAFRDQGVKSSEMDLGSRAVMARAPEWAWYPAEVNTSIRPGWFYHPEEDEKVKLESWLIDLYEHTVGGNAVLLLNIPPTPGGVIHANDAERLLAVGDALRARYGQDLAEGATVQAENAGHTVCLRLAAKAAVSRVVLEERIQESQRVERFAVSAVVDGVERVLYEGTTVGYRKICAMEPTVTDCIVVRVLESRGEPVLQRVSVYA